MATTTEHCAHALAACAVPNCCTHSPPSGDDVLERLKSQNATWAKGVESEKPGFFEQSARCQHPRALWIGCSDSRVPESVLMACMPGEVFVHRNIAK